MTEAVRQSMNFYFQATLCVGLIGALLLMLSKSASSFHWYTEMEDQTEQLVFKGMTAVLGFALTLWAVLVAPCVGR